MVLFWSASASSERALEHDFQQLAERLETSFRTALRSRLASCRKRCGRGHFLLGLRSALRAVQSACGRHQIVRKFACSTILALVLLLTKGRSRFFFFLVLAVIRRVFRIACRANCCLVFRWVPSEVNYGDRGSRFYDADYDPPSVRSIVGVSCDNCPCHHPLLTRHRPALLSAQRRVTTSQYVS